jgi:hypothetical protein
MKKLFIALALFTSCNLFSQTITNTVNPKTDTLAYIGYDINQFSAEYAQEMSTWSNEKIDWFNKTFCYTRGNFTIPDKPIQPYQKED